MYFSLKFYLKLVGRLYSIRTLFCYFIFSKRSRSSWYSFSKSIKTVCGLSMGLRNVCYNSLFSLSGSVKLQVGIATLTFGLCQDCVGSTLPYFCSAAQLYSVAISNESLPKFGCSSYLCCPCTISLSIWNNLFWIHWSFCCCFVLLMLFISQLPFR